jgi:hypothetical protein
VLRAHDRYGDPALLVHADIEALRRLAVPDGCSTTSTTRMAGCDGAVYGVEHEICLHREDKLRTV